MVYKEVICRYWEKGGNIGRWWERVGFYCSVEWIIYIRVGY